jgi:hypothetical protein
MTLIQRFLTGDYTVVRSSRGDYVKGRYVAGPKETLFVCGSLQPSNARELKLPEEGNRLKQFWKFFTDAPILVNSMATLANSDVVVVNGEEYRAMSSIIWQNVDLEYFMTVLWREPSQSNDGRGAG